MEALVSEYLTCSICLSVPTTDNILKCTVCTSICCNTCHTSMITIIGFKCPICRTLPADYVPLTKLELLVLGELDIECEDCGATTKNKDLSRHKKDTCVKRLVKCPWIGCDFVAAFEDIGAHTNDCVCREVQCAQCSETIRLIDTEIHEANSCRFTLLRCAICDLIVMREHMAKHMEGCPKRQVKCQFRDCPSWATYAFLDIHLRECSYRPIPCPTCDIHIPAIYFHEHECPDTPLNCPNPSCDQVVKRITLSLHDSTCPWKLFRCGWNECPQTGIPRQFLQEHIWSECEFRPFPCKKCTLSHPLGSGCIKLLLDEIETLKRKRSNDLDNTILDITLTVGRFLEFTTPILFENIYISCICMDITIHPIGTQLNPYDVCVSIRLKPGVYDHLLTWPLDGTFMVVISSKEHAESCCLSGPDSSSWGRFVYENNPPTITDYPPILEQPLYRVSNIAKDFGLAPSDFLAFSFALITRNLKRQAPPPRV